MYITLKAMVILALGLAVGGCAFFGSQETPVDFWQPVLSPNGEFLAYVAKGAKSYNLFLLNLSTGQERAVVETDQDVVCPSWSPDGTKLAYMTVQEKDNWDIFTVDVATGQVFRVTADPAADVNPSWTTTGVIVFNSNRGGNWGAYAVNPDGTGLRKLSFDRPQDKG
ncbi:PD40 domain-containing protein [Candidatus Bipolaricaulota bacterium]|nr:PD40 domain-containing protein [Candidatus Bipolaricaulota bacterium]